MQLKINNPEEYMVGLYCRLSKEDENKKGDDSESIENQKSLLKKYAKKQNLCVCEEYVDDGYSGTNINRPGLKRLLKDIEDGKVNMVIIKDMSRLCRNYIDMGNLIEVFFPNHGIRLISLLDNFDSEVNGYMDDILPFKSILNDMYAKDISKKITSIKRNKQQEGKFMGWKAAYGYKKDPADNNKIIIDEPASKIVRYIFDLAVNGKSCRQIAVTLNEQKIPTPAQYYNIAPPKKRGHYSGKWSSEVISFMLQNEVYIGSMVQGRMRKRTYKSKECYRLPRENWIVVPNTHEPIIDKETFEKVSQLIKSRNYLRSRKYDYLLKGMIYCHECHTTLGVMNRKLSGNRDTLYFICRTYQRFTKDENTCSCHCARVEDVTNAVISQIREVCQKYISDINMSELTDKAQKILEAKKEKQETVTSLQSKLKSVEMKQDRAYDDKLAGTVDENLFRRTYLRLQDEKETLLKEIQKLESTDDDIELDIERVKELADKFLKAEEYSKSMLIDLIDRVELTKDKEILIYYKFKELDLSSRL